MSKSVNNIILIFPEEMLCSIFNPRKGFNPTMYVIKLSVRCVIHILYPS